MTAKWSLKAEPNIELVQSLKNSLGVPTIIARLLVQRGINNFEQAKLFFRPEITHLHDPFLMKDMSLAADRLHKAILNNEKILVYGDYDVYFFGANKS